jgi:hypothetical protein
MGRKRAQMNFELIFALIAGAAILVLAIYGAMRFGETGKIQTDTEIAKKISVFTAPMQAGISSGKSSKISFSSPARIYNRCLDGNFGENRISVSSSSRAGKEWTLPGGEISVEDKYIFSSEMEEGKELYVFSKPFEFPYKVADLLIISAKQYCFIKPPKEIENDIIDLKLPNVKIASTPAECEGKEKVCFGVLGNCETSVFSSGTNFIGTFNTGYVQKGSRKLYYAGNLMYAAIFSDSDTYECNTKRILYRDKRIIEILKDKAELMNLRGCSTALVPELNIFDAMLADAGQNNLEQLSPFAKSMQDKKNLEECKLW